MAYLEAETQKRADLEKQLADANMILSQAKTESEEILAHAKKEAKTLGWEIVENAKKEASDVLAQANADAESARNKGFTQVELERKNMTEELKWKVLDIALKLNAKLFQKNEAHVEFLKKNATEIDFS